MGSFLIVAAALWLPLGGEAGAADALEIRVGLLAYEDFEAERVAHDILFADLARRSPRPVRFLLASGTYGDILYWLERGRIDVAVVGPGIASVGLSAGPDLESRARCRYLATVTLPPAAGPLALDDRRAAGRHDRYRSVCVVRDGSPIRSLEDLRAACASGIVEFLLVDPLSVSGRIAPAHALRRIGLAADRTRQTFTRSHSASLRLLASPSGGKERVAFVWDGAELGADATAPALRRVPFPELDSLWIPSDVVVARVGFEHADLVCSLLTDARPDEFRVMPDMAERYAVVGSWASELDIPLEGSVGQRVSLEDVGAVLVHHARSQSGPFRLALVFSGGGAKCAYQVGAVAAIEEELAALRARHGIPELDISLVVGTSGGAINALPVALGITSTAAGRAGFRDAWTRLDQREIVRLSWRLRANLGLWFALVQLALVSALVNRRFPAHPERRAWWRGCALVLLGAAEIAIGYLPVTPWAALGTNHLLHHAWLWCSFGVHTSAWCLLAIGLVSLGLGLARLRRKMPGEPRLAPRRLMPLFWVALVALPLIQILTLFLYEETLSGGGGMERTLAEEIPRLIQSRLAEEGLEPLQLDPRQSPPERLRSVSRQVLERGLLRRDLVLTGSCLAQSADDLPGDLYFHAASGRSVAPAPRWGPRGISLAAQPEILLDVVLGSGTIYPVFPPRRILDFPRRGEHVDLVDGGFAHNSPVEAAVLWGATHILLVQAATERRVQRRNFLENVGAAFRHLYDQAQRIDARSKEEVVVFTLAPEPPHVCVIDFAGNLIDAAISRGHADAHGGPMDESVPGGGEGDGKAAPAEGRAAGEPRFRKELGNPRFWEAGSLQGR